MIETVPVYFARRWRRTHPYATLTTGPVFVTTLSLHAAEDAALSLEPATHLHLRPTQPAREAHGESVRGRRNSRRSTPRCARTQRSWYHRIVGSAGRERTPRGRGSRDGPRVRSEEHTSELQSLAYLV